MSAIADEIAELKARAEKAERERDELESALEGYAEARNAQWARADAAESRHAALLAEARKALNALRKVCNDYQHGRLMGDAYKKAFSSEASLSQAIKDAE